MIFTDEYFMRQAIAQAEEAAAEGEVPIGAVITCGDTIIARDHNRTQQLNDVTAHAEMLAITAAEQALGGKYLTECTLYVTVEPCPMCAGAIGWAQIPRIVYGSCDRKRGYSTISEPTGHLSPLHPKAVVHTGLLEPECTEIMQEFFRKKRNR